jgi:RNA recognition motif-containing protein
MAEQYNSDSRRRRRRGRGRPNGEQQQKQSQSKKPTGFQKFLSVISFGLLGGATKPKPRPAAPPVRFEGGEERQRRSDRGGRGERNERQDRPARAPREPRPTPVPAEVTTERLYVGNLSYDATEGDLFELFNGVGKVQNAEVVVNNRTQRSKGFAFITMASVDEAKRAVAELNGKDFMGRPLQLSGAKPSQRGDGEETGSEPTPVEAAA